MSILIDENSKVVVQGITGREGQFHALRNRDYGTKIVAGTRPGKGGEQIEAIPIFNTVKEAIDETGANVALTFVPPAFAKDAVLEAAYANCQLIVCITEGIPAKDEAEMYNLIKNETMSKLLGPNCPGLISPGKSNVGIMPHEITLPGSVGVVSRSGTLTYQAVHELTQLEIGQSTCIGIGGDPLKQYSPRRFQAAISGLKNMRISPGEAIESAETFFDVKVGEIYTSYEKKLMLANSMDFDDLLIKTVDLLETNDEALNFWSAKFKYIMVDEYQDTNLVQYKLIELLSSRHKNLCVVGDSDQSIYAFRGADIRNIQEFEKDFQNAKIITLDKNYRSSQNILIQHGLDLMPPLNLMRGRF